MIPANELRCGNYLKSDVVVKIDARTIFDIWDISKKYEPIPITEEWLLKFGFIEDSFEYIKIISPDGILGIRLNPYDVDFEEIGVCIFQKDDTGITEEHENHYVFLDSIKYIHQLQNLYFALIGKELEYVVKD